MAWCAEQNIINGYSAEIFQPTKTLSRQELAAILYRYAQWKGCDVSAQDDLSAFTDSPSPWALEEVRWAVAEGLLKGTTDHTLNPQGHATRAQLVCVLQRLVKKVVKS